MLRTLLAVCLECLGDLEDLGHVYVQRRFMLIFILVTHMRCMYLENIFIKMFC